MNIHYAVNDYTVRSNRKYKMGIKRKECEK